MASKRISWEPSVKRNFAQNDDREGRYVKIDKTSWNILTLSPTVDSTKGRGSNFNKKKIYNTEVSRQSHTSHTSYTPTQPKQTQKDCLKFKSLTFEPRMLWEVAVSGGVSSGTHQPSPSLPDQTRPSNWNIHSSSRTLDQRTKLKWQLYYLVR